MRTLHVIMPMAGEGSRFLKEGWLTPKPLIMLNGIPLFKHAIHSVCVQNVPIKYSFIVRQEHIDKYGIDKQIKQFIPDAHVFAVQKTTRGAVETCLMAEENITMDESIIVMDCDLEFKSKSFELEMLSILSRPIDDVNGGLLVSFESSLPKYSYAQVDEKNRVVRTAEKQVISSHALCGAYFFSRASDFIYAAHKLLSEPDGKSPEFYVSLLYNYLLEKGDTVLLTTMEEYYSYGTPEELKKYI